MKTSHVAVHSILTRSTGFLKTVSSHSLQPYRGCPFGKSLCGVGCYVQHNPWINRQRTWGTFLEVKENAAEVYRQTAPRERAWAHKNLGQFSIFLSSSTEPFPPQESRLGVTRHVLNAMLEEPPDGLIIQTHSPRVVEAMPVLIPLARLCSLRCHISIESDQDRLPGLPPPASSVAARFEAAETLKKAGVEVIITVAPILPIANPARFFARIAQAAHGVVLDHFIDGDGSPHGRRTLKTKLPDSMKSVDPTSVHISYRDTLVSLAEAYLPGRVGIHINGFSGRWNQSESVPPMQVND